MKTTMNTDDLIAECESFFELINQIESGEANSSKTWNWINREARFAERVKAYEKIFYAFLDEFQKMEKNDNISHSKK